MHGSLDGGAITKLARLSSYDNVLILSMCIQSKFSIFKLEIKLKFCYRCPVISLSYGPSFKVVASFEFCWLLDNMRITNRFLPPVHVGTKFCTLGILEVSKLYTGVIFI